jgi:hypothetical protein
MMLVELRCPECFVNRLCQHLVVEIVLEEHGGGQEDWSSSVIVDPPRD